MFDVHGEINAFADQEGQHSPNTEWLLSDLDVWVRNPHYTGPHTPCPEGESWEPVDTYGRTAGIELDDFIPWF